MFYKVKNGKKCFEKVANKKRNNEFCFLKKRANFLKY